MTPGKMTPEQLLVQIDREIWREVQERAKGASRYEHIDYAKEDKIEPWIRISSSVSLMKFQSSCGVTRKELPN